MKNWGFRCEKLFYLPNGSKDFTQIFSYFTLGNAKNIILILYLEEKEEIYGQCFPVRSYFDHVFIFCEILQEFKRLTGWDVLDKLQSKLEVHRKTILEFKTNAGKEQLAPIKTKIMANASEQERKCRCVEFWLTVEGGHMPCCFIYIICMILKSMFKF